MQWSDEAIVLSVRPHGETAAVTELFTRAHGRHLALIHGGRSRKLRPVLQTGNHVDATWKARLSEHLGHATVELRKGYAAASMDNAAALAGLTSLCTLSRLLPERDPHPALFEITLFVLSFLDDVTVWPALMVRWELALLEELGFGLDLSECASTGSNDQLIYVSPKSGRAVSASAGEIYYQYYEPSRAGGYCSSVSVFFAKLLRLFDFDAFTIDFGLSSGTHVTVILHENVSGKCTKACK